MANKSNTTKPQCTNTHYRDYYESRCHNPGKVERDGKWFCGVHDPVWIEAKRQKRANARAEVARVQSERYQAKKAVEAEHERKAAAYPALLEALEKIRDAMETDATDGARVTAYNIARAAIEEASKP